LINAGEQGLFMLNRGASQPHCLEKLMRAERTARARQNNKRAERALFCEVRLHPAVDANVTYAVRFAS
jgi:hypothetical protein